MAAEVGKQGKDARVGVPLFVRLFALAFVAGVVPLAAVGWATLDLNADALRHSSRELHLAIVSDAVRAVRGELGRVREELNGVGQLLLAPDLGDDDRRLALAGARVTASERIDWVTLYAPDGERLGTLKAEETPAPETPEFLPHELRDAALKSQLATGEVRRAGKEPTLDLVWAVVVDGETRGYLLCSLRLGALTATMTELAERRLGDPRGVYVVDDERELVLASDPARVKASESWASRGAFTAIEGKPSFRNAIGLTPEFRLDGRDMLGAIETIPEVAWAVVAEQPLDVAYAPLVRVRRLLAIALGAAALFALLAGLLGARSITQPVAALVEATKALAKRDFKAVPALVVGRRDEIGVLGRAFQQAAGDLDRSERKLLHEARVRDSLSRYLPGGIVDLIVKDPARLRLAGEKREITVLFADVVGFTRLTETLPPEQVVALLNELFTVATEIVQRRGGMVDKFVGDAVMAVWGTPQPSPSDSANAALAADDLRRWVEALNRKFRKLHGVEVQLGFGLATGPGVAGNIGSDKRLDYTVIGSTVNIAARLEALAEPGQILINALARERIGDSSALRELGPKNLPGRSLPELVWEVVA